MKRNFWLILIPVLVTVICGTLSFLAGHYVPWTPLGTPPEPAVEILRATRGSVIVEAISGKIYRCAFEPVDAWEYLPFSQYTPPNDTCVWQPINLADFGPGTSEKDNTCADFLPPGRITDRFYVCSSPEWRYVVLTDGSVWTYYSDTSDVTGEDIYALLIRLAFWPFLGPVMSLLLGLAIFYFLWQRHKRVT